MKEIKRINKSSNPKGVQGMPKRNKKNNNKKNNKDRDKNKGQDFGELNLLDKERKKEDKGQQKFKS